MLCQVRLAAHGLAALHELSLLCLGAVCGEGLPYTLGFAPPEVMAHGHSSTSLSLAQSADIYAVGIMGLLWLSNQAEMPFGPTQEQARQMEHVECSQVVRDAIQQDVQDRQAAWVRWFASV